MARLVVLTAGLLAAFACCFMAGLLIFPTVNDAVSAYSQAQHEFQSKIMKLVQYLQFCHSVAACAPLLAQGGSDLVAGCTRHTIAVRWFLGAHGWKGAGAGIKSHPEFGQPGLFYFSHEGVAKNANDPDLVRGTEDFFATSLTSLKAKKVVPDKGLFPVTINMATNDSERIERRAFMSDFFSALAQTPPWPLNLNDRPMAAGDSQNRSAIKAAVGFSIFKMLFDVELEPYELAGMYDWAATMRPCAADKCACSPESCMKTQSFFAKLVKTLAGSTVGKRYLRDAKKRGLHEPMARLREMVFLTLYFGYGGTGDTTLAAVSMLNSDRAGILPIFYKDPYAFVLEIARLYPGVAGTTAVSGSSHVASLGNGRAYNVTEGDRFTNWNAAANIDATIFGGENISDSYATEFHPERENAERLLTFNGELLEMRRCGHAKGYPECKKAARACPGTFLALHIMQTVTTWFADSMDVPQVAESNAGHEPQHVVAEDSTREGEAKTAEEEL